MNILIKPATSCSGLDIYIDSRYAGSVYPAREGWTAVVTAAYDNGHAIITRREFDNRADAISFVRVVYVARIA